MCSLYRSALDGSAGAGGGDGADEGAGVGADPDAEVLGLGFGWAHASVGCKSTVNRYDVNAMKRTLLDKLIPP